MSFLWPCYINALGPRDIRNLVGEFETFLFREYIILRIYNET